MWLGLQIYAIMKGQFSLKRHGLKAQLLVLQNITVFGDMVFMKYLG